MEWLGNPLLYVFVSFFGPDCVQLSIAFPSFWTYWPVETLHEFIQSQFLKKKQRIVRPTLPSTAPLFSTLIFAGFPNQSPLVTMIARSSLFFFYVDQSRSHEWPSMTTNDHGWPRVRVHQNIMTSLFRHFIKLKLFNPEIELFWRLNNQKRTWNFVYFH